MAAPSRTYLQPDYRRRPDAAAFIGRDSPLFDTLFVLVPLAALLFNPVIGPLTILLIMASVGGYVLLRYETLVSVLLSSWPLLLLPLFCLGSVLWSEAPAATLRYGTLYLVTVFTAIIVGAGTARLSALKATQLAFSFYMLCSILFGRWVGWQDGVYAFAGLAGSKNAAGDAAGIALMISTAMLCWSIPRRSLLWGGIALGTIPIALFCLVTAKSTGAILATAVGIMCLVPWIISRAFGRPVRVLIFSVCLTVGVIGLATTPFWMDQIFESVLTSAGKDDNITGRKDLWEVSDRYIAAQPWLGLGYSAFWIEDNLDAIRLWNMLGIPLGNPFNFHNTARGIAVELGFVGLGLFALVWLYCAVRLLLTTMMRPSYFGIYCSALLMFMAPRLHFEMLGYSNMHFPSLILLMALACGLRPTQPEQQSRPRKRANAG